MRLLLVVNKMRKKPILISKDMNSNEIYQKYEQEMYFFILKNVKNKNITNDIFQSSFLKIHKNIHQLKDEQKSRAWVFQNMQK